MPVGKILQAWGPEGFGNYEVTWGPAGPQFEKAARHAQGVLIPGFVDLHIHGAFGVDFMTASDSDLLLLCDKLGREGYEVFLPTTVTAPYKAVLQAVSRLPNSPMVAGFHLEGPFISPSHPGAQSASDILEPPAGRSDWDPILEHPQLRYATLAPELPRALELITRLMKRRVVVSMGHTDATYDQARTGYEFGASSVTHTFNAMRGFHHREAGVLGYALLSDSIYTELIYDRKHVSQEAARLLFQCRPLERIVAVSDSTMATGMPANLSIEMWGRRCVTGNREVRLEDGTLAGSAITLLDAFRNLAEDFGLEAAIQVCCVNPRRLLGMSGLPRTYVELDNDLHLVERFSATA